MQLTESPRYVQQCTSRGESLTQQDQAVSFVCRLTKNMAIKITRTGQACRECKTPVVKRTHTKPSKPKQKYWYQYWFACPNPRCGKLYMVEAAKVKV